MLIEKQISQSCNLETNLENKTKKSEKIIKRALILYFELQCTSMRLKDEENLKIIRLSKSINMVI